jgi:hypothetical protein
MEDSVGFAGQPLWDCNQCTCGYGQEDTPEGCKECHTKPTNMVPRPTKLLSCDDRSQYQCAKGYYEESNTCVKCIDSVPTCSLGFYAERCLRHDRPVCHPCTNALPNATSQTYGPHVPVPECTGNYYDGNCALFLTPSWDTYACSIYCDVGYANVAPPGPVDCRPCAEVCERGTYCPYATNVHRQCTPCNHLNPQHTPPDNAEWLEDCQWRCRPGFFLIDNNEGFCERCATDQKCRGETPHQFMGCSRSFAGECRPADPAQCVAGVTFLYFEVHWDAPLCRPCSPVKPNVTYQVAACTQARDTQLGYCRSVCPTDHYQTAPCTATADLQCRPCTAGVAGQLRVAPCTATADARFVPCPENSACDGGPIASSCTPPLVARKGLCVCPPATALPGCTPIVCPLEGWFPNATLDACSPCPGLQLRTRPGVLGLSACVCPPGHFMQWADDELRCWPCGDLGCTPGLQQQSACPGDSTAEPDCLCSVPPGARLLSPDRCTSECAPGMEPSVLALEPSLKWQTASFVRMLPPTTAPPTTPIAKLQGLALIGPELAVLVTGKGQLAVHFKETAYAVDLVALLIPEGSYRAKLLNDSVRVCADAQLNRFWVGFSFLTTACNGTVSVDLQPCSTIELVEVAPGAQCTCDYWTDCPLLPLCLNTFFRGEWGNTIQGGFAPWRIEAMHTDNGQTLYLWLDSGQVVQYAIAYYVIGTPARDRAPDFLHNVSGLHSSTPAALAVVGSTLFMPGLHWGPATLHVPSPSATHLYALGDHVLGQGQQQVDIWNGFALPLLLQPLRFGHGRLATYNGTHLQLRPAEVCPQDTFALLMDGSSSCVPLPCVRLRDACGPFTLRIRGKPGCQCIPGYYRNQQCEPCPANYYCPPGAQAPETCGPNADSPPAASAIEQCACKSGFYPFQQGRLCLACPVGFWCLGGRTLPIPCMPRSTTRAPASTTPLDCVCGERTYGFTCTPCKPNEYSIKRPSQAQPKWEALRLEGLSTVALHIADCVPADAAVYSVPPPPIHQLHYSWAWIIAIGAGAQGNLTGCMLAQGLAFQNTQTFTAERATTNFADTKQCFMNQEWGGPAAPAGKPCVCIPGYRTVGGICLPCPNGTIRARYAPDVCVPCPLNNSHAPWPAMSHCVCRPGFFLNDEECTPVPLRPSLFSVFSNPGVAVVLALAAGALCVLGSVAAALLTPAY